MVGTAFTRGERGPLPDPAGLHLHAAPVSRVGVNASRPDLAELKAESLGRGRLRQVANEPAVKREAQARRGGDAMRRVVSVYLPHWSTDRLRKTTAKSPPDGGGLLAGTPLVTAIPVHAAASSRRSTPPPARSA